MKRKLTGLLAAALALALLLGGCGADSAENAGSADDAADSGEQYGKGERVDIYDGDDELLRSLETTEALDEFFKISDSIGTDEEDTDDGDVDTTVEETHKKELSFVLVQRPTETVLGGKPAEDEREEVLRLVLYEGSDTAWMRVKTPPLPLQFHVKLPKETQDALCALAAGE